jgi:hypothetical protein
MVCHGNKISAKGEGTWNPYNLFERLAMLRLLFSLVNVIIIETAMLTQNIYFMLTGKWWEFQSECIQEIKNAGTSYCRGI